MVPKAQHSRSLQWPSFTRNSLAGFARKLTAQDVCVRAAVLDALEAGFEVHVLVAATAPVQEADGRQALEDMQGAGAILE